MNLSDVWCEKYKPRTLDDIILSDANRLIIEKIKNKETGLPNLLFSGRPGIGKTSLAKLIVEDVVENCHSMYINASDENGIDIIRNKIVKFARTQAAFGFEKVIIFDEADGLTQDAQKALRSCTEEYISNCRFIFTCNHINKLSAAMQSRFMLVSLNMPRDLYEQRLRDIWSKEVKKDINEIDFKKIVSSNYPDLRSGIIFLQKYSLTGTISDEEICKKLIDDVIKYIKTDKYSKARDFLIKKSDLHGNNYDMLFVVLFNYIAAMKITDNIRLALVSICEYMNQNNTCIDQEINFYACLLDIKDNIV
jgi:DNA polymerase III delta prime subunit